MDSMASSQDVKPPRETIGRKTYFGVLEENIQLFLGNLSIRVIWVIFG
jgi:hypothetical protein